MSMIERYKKKGGFIQLVGLIETTPQPKRDHFLDLIAKEHPIWEEEVRKKMLTVERVSTWEPVYLTDVLSHVPASNVMVAIFPLSPVQRTKFLESMSYADRRKAEDFFLYKTPLQGEVVSCQARLFTEIRTMVAQGNLKFEKCDPDLFTPENIEEQLNLKGGIRNHHGGEEAEVPRMEGERTGRSESQERIESAEKLESPTSLVRSEHPEASDLGGADGAEVISLRRQVQQLTRDNVQLHQQLKNLQEKLGQIKKIA